MRVTESPGQNWPGLFFDRIRTEIKGVGKMDTKRPTYWRDQAAECERRSANARNVSDKQAWLIAARGWKNMAEREELKHIDVEAAPIPAGDRVEEALAKLAAKSRK